MPNDTPTPKQLAEIEYLRRAIAERFRGHVLSDEAMGHGPPVVTPQMLRDFLLDAGATPDIVVERDPDDPSRVIVSKPMPVTIIAGKL